MITWLEDVGGRPIAFLHGRYIHAPTGRVIGFVDEGIIRRIYGEAVGVLRGNTIIDPVAPDKDMLEALTAPSRRSAAGARPRPVDSP